MNSALMLCYYYMCFGYLYENLSLDSESYVSRFGRFFPFQKNECDFSNYLIVVDESYQESVLLVPSKIQAVVAVPECLF